MENITELLNEESNESTEKDIIINNSTEATEEDRSAESEGTEAPEEKTESTGKIFGRGRHKKDCICDKCKAKKILSTDTNTATTATDSGTGKDTTAGNQNSKVTDSNPLDLSEFKKTEISTESSNPTEVNASKYLTGSIILMMIDAVIPSVLLKIMSFSNPKYKAIKTKDIKLSKDQKQDLEPLADEVVKTMTVAMSPVSAFLLCTSLIYGTNLMSVSDE